MRGEEKKQGDLGSMWEGGRQHNDPSNVPACYVVRKVSPLPKNKHSTGNSSGKQEYYLLHIKNIVNNNR